MPTGNNEYIVEVAGADFESFQLSEVLPEHLVEAYEGGNQLAGQIIVHWLEHTPKRKRLFDRVTEEGSEVIRFRLKARNV